MQVHRMRRSALCQPPEELVVEMRWISNSSYHLQFRANLRIVRYFLLEMYKAAQKKASVHPTFLANGAQT